MRSPSMDRGCDMRLPEIETKYPQVPREDEAVHARGKWLIVSFLLSAALFLSLAAIAFGSLG